MPRGSRRSAWSVAGWAALAAFTILFFYAVLSPLRDLLAEPQGAIAGLERVSTGGPATGIEASGWIDTNRARQGAEVDV